MTTPTLNPEALARPKQDRRVSCIAMRPWHRIEPDAKRWATAHYGDMSRFELRMLVGKGHRSKTATQMRNILVKRHVAFVLEQWSRDVSAGRKVNENAL